MADLEHKKTYLKHFGYSEADTPLCECCGAPAVDIHHIEARGMGSKQTTRQGLYIHSIDNLMGLCRNCHQLYGDVSDVRPLLQELHALHMRHYRKTGYRPYEQQDHASR